MKQTVNTPSGGKKKIKTPRVGVVLWNGETGDLAITGEELYMPVVNAIAGAMLTMDQVNLIAVPQADIYPVYGNANAVRVVMTVVAVNLGESVVHDVESLKPWLGALGKQVENMGLHHPAKDLEPRKAEITPLSDAERQRRTPDDRGNVPPWNPK